MIEKVIEVTFSHLKIVCASVCGSKQVFFLSLVGKLSDKN